MFKVGDKVRVIKETDDMAKGTEGAVTVVRPGEKFPYMVTNEDDKTEIFTPSELELIEEAPPEDDPVRMPTHYRQVPGVECIDVIKHFNFPVGSAIKYLWRHEHKGDPIENLEKAIENIQFEIKRRKELND